MRDGVLVSEVRVRGPLADYACGFAGFLAAQGYMAGSTRLQLGLISQLSRWLDPEGVDVAGLTELEAERFITARRARGCRLFRSRRALEPMIGYLRGLGVAPAPVAIGPVTPVDGHRSLRQRRQCRVLTSRTSDDPVNARPFQRTRS